jgi:hypothetical protein|tara:strand:+ start:1027 stop:1188 length:162 start_codon:yes stop_codon:yes gene_type:complete
VGLGSEADNAAAANGCYAKPQCNFCLTDERQQWAEIANEGWINECQLDPVRAT